MPQFGRPSADTNNPGGFVDEGSASTNLFQSIDEVTASDTDFIQSPTAPSNDVYVTKLSTLEDPQTGTGHTVRYRYEKNTSGGAQIDLTVQLRSGYVSEATPGTLIASWTHTNIGTPWTTQTQNLSTTEADNISAYNDLYLRFDVNQV